jgi:hypothetical protein
MTPKQYYDWLVEERLKRRDEIERINAEIRMLNDCIIIFKNVLEDK